MSAEDFVKAFYLEKEDMLNNYIGAQPRFPQYPALGRLKIQELNLTDAQLSGMREVIDIVLTDAFYSMLLGLDGEANIGGMQELFTLLDESGTQISGDIEGFAYEYFHQKKYDEK